MSRKKEAMVDHDNPEWRNEDFRKAARVKPGTSLVEAAKAVRMRGRPEIENPKQAISLRIDRDVLKAYRELGSGWQSRMNADLRKARKLKA